MGPRRFILLALALLLAVPGVEAHANYYKSEPARGARLAEAPSEVSVTLSEEIDASGSGLEVVDQRGDRVDEGPVRFTGGPTPVLAVDLVPGLPPGAYQARWKALSSVDGHVTSGTFGFAVGGAFEPPADAEARTDYDALSAASRTAAYAGYALGFGVLAFALHIDPASRGEPRPKFRARAAALGGLLLFLGISGLFLHTMAQSGLGAAGFLRTTVGKEFGLRVAVASLTLAAGVILWRRGLGGRVNLLFAFLLLLGAIGNSLFVHSAQKGWAAVGIDLAHLVSVSVWLGGLGLFLHHILWASRAGTYDDVIAVGRRFSGVALASVIVLGLSGLASTFLILGVHPFRAPWALVTHPYGAFLAGKILLFGAMVGLASVNRFIFLGKQPGPDGAPRPRWVDALRPNPQNRGTAFARAVGLEASLGAVVLLLAGFLTAISPPSGLAETDADDSLQRIGFGQAYDVTLVLAPAPEAGQASNISLRIREAETGDPLDEAIRVRVSIVAQGQNESAGEVYTARPAGDGRWIVGDVFFPREGAHEARVEIQTEEVYRDTVSIPFPVAGAAGATVSESDKNRAANQR